MHLFSSNFQKSPPINEAKSKVCRDVGSMHVSPTPNDGGSITTNTSSKIFSSLPFSFGKDDNSIMEGVIYSECSPIFEEETKLSPVDELGSPSGMLLRSDSAKFMEIPVSYSPFSKPVIPSSNDLMPALNLMGSADVLSSSTTSELIAIEKAIVQGLLSLPLLGNEIKREDLGLNTLIGQGTFAHVYNGTYL